MVFKRFFLQQQENLALFKLTWEQYPWPKENTDYGSENAVDGKYANRGNQGQCTISDDGKYNATWRVDLGGVVSISYIDFYYRLGNLNGRTLFAISFKNRIITT